MKCEWLSVRWEGGCCGGIALCTAETIEGGSVDSCARRRAVTVGRHCAEGAEGAEGAEPWREPRKEQRWACVLPWLQRHPRQQLQRRLPCQLFARRRGEEGDWNTANPSAGYAWKQTRPAGLEDGLRQVPGATCRRPAATCHPQCGRWHRHLESLRGPSFFLLD